MDQVAFIDTETCGLDPVRNPVWEVAVIVDDVEHVWQQKLPLTTKAGVLDPSQWWQPAAQPSTASDLGLPCHDTRPPLATRYTWVSTWVTENTGITERYVHDDALHPGDSIYRFADLVRGRHLVGAVPSFDAERLGVLARRHIDPIDLPWHYHLIDVETLAVGFLCGLGALLTDYRRPSWWKLRELPWHSDELSRGVGVQPPAPDERHTALADARWAKRLYEAVLGA